MHFQKVLIVTFFLLFMSPFAFSKTLPLNKLIMLPGFSVNIYAVVPDARSMTLGDKGIVFVGTRSLGKVYALMPNKTQTKAKNIIVIADNLEMPNGVAYYHGDLYVAEVSRVLRYTNIENHLQHSKYVVITNSMPTKKNHGWRFIRFGPDGRLYVAIGAPCNVCISKDLRFATISSMRSDGSDFKIYAKGVRNSVGFDWDPQNQKLWFTDNGRDWLGDNIPPDELNYAPKIGMDFGFPYFWGDNQPDPIYGHLRSKKGMTIPAMKLGPHVAALGMTFYRGKMFPKQYWGQIIIAEHGSWNRTQKIGYQLSIVTVKDNRAKSYKSFITGWLQKQNVWGRPVDVLVMPDGALLVSDDFAGVVYRVAYHIK